METIKVKKNHFLYYVICILMSMVLLGFIIANTYSVPSEIAVRISAAVLIAIYVLSLIWWGTVTHKYTSLFFVFFIYCFFSNAGQTLLYLFNIKFTVIVQVYERYSSNLLIKMHLHQALCILSLMFGGVLANSKHSAARSSLNIVSKSSLNGSTRRHTKVADVTFLISTALVLAIFASRLFVRTINNYGAAYEQYEASSINITIYFAYHVLLFASIINHFHDKYKKAIYVVAITMAILMLIAGTRSYIIPSLFGILFLGTFLEKEELKLKRKQVVLGVVLIPLFLIFLNGMFRLRQYPLQDISWSTIGQAYSANFFSGLVDAVQEMGGSARSVLLTMHLVDNGVYNGEPTIAYSWLKGFCPIELLSFFGFDQPLRLELSKWITNEGGSTSGWGYSIIAEVYYNFGSYAFAFMFFFGSLFVKLENWCIRLIKRGHIYAGCSVLYLLAYAIFLARADMFLMSSRIRLCVYVLIASYLFYVLKNKHWQLPTSQIFKERKEMD